MSTITISRDQARELDRRAIEEYGMAAATLMENAGRGVADTLCQLGISRAVTICCGTGNNGGDGFVVARHLDLRGYEVRVLVFGDPAALRGEAAANYRILERSDVPLRRAAAADIDHESAGADWLVDSLLGTGARGEPRPPLAAAIERMNAVEVPVLAVDLPSGLDCDSGQPARCTVEAAHTCTFVAWKPGFLLPSAERFTGTVHVLDIGAPRKLVNEILGLGHKRRDLEA